MRLLATWSKGRFSTMAAKEKGYPMDPDTLARCQELLEYTFQDESLLVLALTHASAASRRVDSNERLEFLGDAVLGLAVCHALFELEDQLLEGGMTKIKSTVVSRKTCALIVRNSGMDEFVHVGSDMARTGEIPESVAAGLLEGVLGAVYIDGGYDPAAKMVLRYTQPFIDEALRTSHQENFKSLLQQHAQQRSQGTPVYQILDEQGPDHSKCFEIAVALQNRHYPSAWGNNKKEAEQAAARQALLVMGVLQEEGKDAGEQADAANEEGPTL